MKGETSHPVRNYNPQLLNAAFELMYTIELAEVLWRSRNSLWQESMDYGNVLRRDSVKKLEEEIKRCSGEQPELKRLMESVHAFLVQFDERI